MVEMNITILIRILFHKNTWQNVANVCKITYKIVRFVCVESLNWTT